MTVRSALLVGQIMTFSLELPVSIVRLGDTHLWMELVAIARAFVRLVLFLLRGLRPLQTVLSALLD